MFVLVLFLFAALPEDRRKLSVQVPRITRWSPATARLSCCTAHGSVVGRVFP